MRSASLAPKENGQENQDYAVLMAWPHAGAGRKSGCGELAGTGTALQPCEAEVGTTAALN
jgi:hypothetical protein